MKSLLKRLHIGIWILSFQQMTVTAFWIQKNRLTCIRYVCGKERRHYLWMGSPQKIGFPIPLLPPILQLLTHSYCPQISCKQFLCSNPIWGTSNFMAPATFPWKILFFLLWLLWKTLTFPVTPWAPHLKKATKYLPSNTIVSEPSILEWNETPNLIVKETWN